MPLSRKSPDYEPLYKRVKHYAWRSRLAACFVYLCATIATAVAGYLVLQVFLLWEFYHSLDQYLKGT